MRIIVSDSVGVLNVSDNVGTLNVSDSSIPLRARQSNMFIKSNGALKRAVFGDKNILTTEESNE